MSRSSQRGHSTSTLAVHKRLTLLIPLLLIAALASVMVIFMARSNGNSNGASGREGDVRVAEQSTTRAATASPVTASPPTAGPLRVDAANPRYFVDANGNLVYLAGSHTWQNLQNGSLKNPPPDFNYSEWLDFLQAHNHNFFRLWVWEQSWQMVVSPEPFYFTPHPFQRTGPENALDGQPKFDLNQFNQAYFDRMRERVIEARERGIYVSVMLFNGWSVSFPKGSNSAGNPWLGHPFNASNNVNGINGDVNRDNDGSETHTLAVPSVLAIQEAYVKKVIDTVNDLDNVLYEISNESNNDARDWQVHMIDFIKAYEATKPNQHPVGMTVAWPDGINSHLFASPADWISLNGDINNPPVATGEKVIIADTDHLCGICGDRTWVWKSFTRGENPIFMDQYKDDGDLEGSYDLNNPNDVSLRRNLGYTRNYANRMNLAAMTPRPELASTTYVLANTPNDPGAKDAEYLVYMPPGNSSFTVDLSATPAELFVEWLNPATGEAVPAASIEGGQTQTFTPPFAGDAVLYLYQSVPTYALTLAMQGEGSAEAQPPGPYVRGQVITLTAWADPGWNFAGWQGAVNTSQNPIALTINANTTVTATFTQTLSSTHELFVPAVGNGKVTRVPDQPDYGVGQAVTLTAVPEVGWAFVGWSGDVEGSENPIVINMVNDTTITATFAIQTDGQYTLGVDLVGSGEITRAPDQPTYALGQVVTLTAVPEDGWVFVAWQGDSHGIENPKRVRIDADTLITATFSHLLPNAPQLRVNVVGQGLVEADPLGPYTTTQVVTLTTTPADGWQFFGWSGDASGTENPLAFAIHRDSTLTATLTLSLPHHLLYLGNIRWGSVADQQKMLPNLIIQRSHQDESVLPTE